MQLLCSSAVEFLSCAGSWICCVQLDFQDFCAVIFQDRFRWPWKTAPTTPLEFTKLYRLPPLPNRPEKLLQLPPRIHRTLPTTPPPSKSSGKTAPTTPLEFTELYRLPPLPNIPPPWNSPNFVQLEKILRITPGYKIAWTWIACYILDTFRCLLSGNISGSLLRKWEHSIL